MRALPTRPGASASLNGGVAERKEFADLTKLIAAGGGDVVAAAIAGAPLPDIPTGAQRQTVGALEWGL